MTHLRAGGDRARRYGGRAEPGTVGDVPDVPAKLPIRMLHDRVLVAADREGERRSSAGIVIPATAAVGTRMAWAQVVALGASVRSVQIGDRVLFDPQERAEVELHGSTYVLLREREIHAVASERLDGGGTGLYL